MTLRVAVDGDTAIVVITGAAFTVRAIVVAWTWEPELPVMVTVLAPTVALEVAWNVIVLAAVVGFVPYVTVTPVGSVELLRLTLPVKPPDGVTVRVLALLAAPWNTGIADGDTDRTKVVAGLRLMTFDSVPCPLESTAYTA